MLTRHREGIHGTSPLEQDGGSARTGFRDRIEAPVAERAEESSRTVKPSSGLAADARRIAKPRSGSFPVPYRTSCGTGNNGRWPAAPHPGAATTQNQVTRIRVRIYFPSARSMTALIAFKITPLLGITGLGITGP